MAGVSAPAFLEFKMKYKALKDVIVDGTQFQKGATIEITHDKVHRLVMLGFIAPEAKKKAKKKQTKVVKFEYQEDA